MTRHSGPQADGEATLCCASRYLLPPQVGVSLRLGLGREGAPRFISFCREYAMSRRRVLEQEDGPLECCRHRGFNKAKKEDVSWH